MHMESAIPARIDLGDFLLMASASGGSGSLTEAGSQTPRSVSVLGSTWATRDAMRCAQECLQSWPGECPHATPCVCVSVARRVSCTDIAQHCISAPRRMRVSPPLLQCLARSLSESLSVTLNLSPSLSLSLSLCRSLCLSSSRSAPLPLSFIFAIVSLWSIL